MKWTTWQNVGVDRMACAWLIRRFIDANGKFQFIAEGQAEVPANTVPFDMPGVRLSHHQGHCSFHAFLKEYKLKDPILQRMARIIDEADTIQEVPVEPAAAGLDMICRGIRLTSPDDSTAIDRGILIYNALYAQLTADTD